MNQNTLHKTLTHKSGQFIFSARFDLNNVIKRLIEADAKYQMVKSLPVLPRIHADLDEDLIRTSIHGTAAIEGNPLNKDEVNHIISAKGDYIPNNEREQEIVNLKKAYDTLKYDDKQPSKIIVSEQFLCNIHTIIIDGIKTVDNIPGQYRNVKVFVGDADHGGTYIPPKIFEDIKNLMKHFEEWINSEEILKLHPIIRGILAHYHIGLIHPFRDGNGRVSRFIEAAIFSSSGWRHVGIMMSNYYYKYIDDYYIAFRKSENDKTHAVDDFINFAIDGVLYCIQDLTDAIHHDIRILAIRDYIYFLKEQRTITKRQFELINILLTSRDSITIKSLYKLPYYRALYTNVSEQTARRDINRLLEYELLNKQNNSYSVNIHTLDFVG